MKITTILFDLDGTLLPMDQEIFVKAYFGGISKRLAPLGYEPQKLISTIWEGTAAMVKNDGSVTNEIAFWKQFAGLYGEEKARRDYPVFECYYQENFDDVARVCGHDPRAREVVDFLKEKGLRRVLATNPIFPSVATEKRMAWAGLSPLDFEYFTTYENSHYCKPNPSYYREILEKIGCDPAECAMVGNDVGEDMIAREIGMQVFLLTDCIINKGNDNVEQYPHGGFDDLLDWLKKVAD
ncbi:MAG: HAD family hydrolase [Ruminococcaceae bacterium]|nr:HAD family hydrolase [Oscillospiraceae bacterium]